MRTIAIQKVGDELTSLILEKEPVDEDIGVLGENGEVIGVLIPKDAYDFFLRKVEEEEEALDLQTVEDFHASGEKTNE
jgi:PHD/YefM family antitoxin component YafN of YafNO toxin-antitoxin module